MNNNFNKFLKFLNQVILYLILIIIGLTGFNSTSRLTGDEIKIRKIKLGIDRLIETNFDEIKGKNILLLTNFAGRTSTGKLTLDAVLESKNVNLIGILTPEHGFYSTITAGEHVSDTKIKNIPVYSLYGKNRRPNKKMLDGCDLILVDIQEIGIRSYTYISTLYNIMDAASEFGISVMVLDRPNPLGGLAVDGMTVEPGFESFVSIIPTAYVHGCTIGELAHIINEENWLSLKNKNLKDSKINSSNNSETETNYYFTDIISDEIENNNSNEKSNNIHKCNLIIVTMSGWNRSMLWEDTGLQWFPTSPNIPTPDAIRGAAMLGAFGELGIGNIGIGTTLPFQYLGNNNFNTDLILDEIKNLDISGVNFYSTFYSTTIGKSAGKEYKGFLLKFNKDEFLEPFTNGVKIMLSLRKLIPEFFKKENIQAQSETMFKKVTGTDELYNSLIKKATDEYVLKASRRGLDNYLKIRAKYLLYN